MAQRAEPVSRTDTRRSALLLAAAGQILFLAAVLMGYRLGRHLADGHPAQALQHAREIWDLERLLHLPDEASMQRFALRWHGWIRPANYFYVGVHYPATAAFLIWAWWRHRDSWARVRAAIVLSLVVALVIHVAYPLAPPRMLPGHGLVDLMTVYGPSAYSTEPGQGMSNQFAAMPSLHVGWALLIAWGVIRYGGGRWRWAIVAHPVLTTLVVVLTANHYWLDGIVGAAIVLLCVAVTVRLDNRERRPREIASEGDQIRPTAGGEPLRR